MREYTATKEQESKRRNKDNRRDSAQNCDKRKGDLLEEWIDHRKRKNRPL